MQSFAIIPAAGRSERMGQPKLLLPWGHATVIEHVIAAWRASRVGRVLIVVHPLDARLAELAAGAGAEVIRPSTPPSEMKESVRIALEFVSHYRPQARDAWLLAPADMPGLTAMTIDALIAAYEASVDGDACPPIWAPICRGRRGHPVLFSWSMAAEVPQLSAHEGINALLERNAVGYVEAAEDSIFEDLDTPDDYDRLRSRYEQ